MEIILIGASRLLEEYLYFQLTIPAFVTGLTDFQLITKRQCGSFFSYLFLNIPVLNQDGGIIQNVSAPDVP